MRDERRIVSRLLPLLWGALTLIGSLANQYAWGHPDQLTGSTGQLDSLCKLLDNAVQTVNAPFWFVAWHVFNAYTSLAAALAVNGIGFACWFVAVLILFQIRRRLHARPCPAREVATRAPSLRPALSRRAFVTDSAVFTGAACMGAGGVYSSFVTPWSLTVARYTIPIAGLPRALDGLRLAQLTDTHLGPRIPASFISEAVDLARSLKPDLYLLTGDFVHMGTAYIEPAAALFRPLLERRAGLIGTIGVLGNHDHYADAPRMSAALAAIGVRMIDNRRLFLDPHDRELTPIRRTREAVCIAGVDDLLEGVVDLPAALQDVPADVPRLLLSHNPDVAEHHDLRAPHRRVDLMIAGHTHGGQVRLPLVGSPIIPSKFGQKYAHGLIQGPHCPVLVSAGVGMSLIPVRVGVPPEVVEITLKPA